MSFDQSPHCRHCLGDAIYKYQSTDERMFIRLSAMIVILFSFGYMASQLGEAEPKSTVMVIIDVVFWGVLLAMSAGIFRRDVIGYEVWYVLTKQGHYHVHLADNHYIWESERPHDTLIAFRVKYGGMFAPGWRIAKLTRGWFSGQESDGSVQGFQNAHHWTVRPANEINKLILEHMNVLEPHDYGEPRTLLKHIAKEEKLQEGLKVVSEA